MNDSLGFTISALNYDPPFAIHTNHFHLTNKNISHHTIFTYIYKHAHHIMNFELSPKRPESSTILRHLNHSFLVKVILFLNFTLLVAG